MHLRRVLLAALLACLSVPSLVAQTATDIIRGRVTNDSSRAVVGALVYITRGPDRAFKQTTTDSAGRYSVAFENGTGDYLVAVSSVGLKSARRRVQRQNSERELVADFTLATDVGAAERWADGVNGQVPPSMAGNLSAIAGNAPGMTQGAGGISVLGSGAESNLTTLNGMALPGGTLPRAARVDTRVTSATFDPVRGGFSGANVDVRLGPGSRNFQERNGFLTFDAPALQATDAIGQSLGARYGSYRGTSAPFAPKLPRYDP
jgi:Carboxypeptidase regulatory-like domain